MQHSEADMIFTACCSILMKRGKVGAVSHFGITFGVTHYYLLHESSVFFCH